MIMRLCAAAALALAPMAGTAATSLSVLENTVVFGDSLSDAGFFGGQATDGDVWAAQLGIDFASGRNFAVGGARAASNPTRSDFAEQRAVYAGTAPTVTPYTNAVVWFGGNDLLNATGPGDITDAVTAILNGIVELRLTQGITRFVVPGLPDLGLIPANINNPNPAAAPTASFASSQFNMGLSGALSGLSAFGINARFVDMDMLFDEITGSGAFANTTDTCLRGAISCDGYVFWDPIHPTDAAHAIVADALSAELAALPLPAAGWLLLAGAGGLAMVGRKKRGAVAA